MNLREKPLIAAYACRVLAGSMVRPWTNRLGKVDASVSWCHVPPAFVAMPRAKPVLLHGPHHDTYAVPSCMETAVAECPAPRSKAFLTAEASRAAQTFWTV